MPNRLIRDGLLESEAVLSMPVEGRWLYVSILLSADDVGLFEATQFKLARRADLKSEMVARLLPMLVDADLVRLYPGPGIRTFGFIPRFQQRLQIKRAKYPLPPDAMLSDDEDALKKINHLRSLATVAEPLSTVGQRSEPEPEPEVTPPSLPSGEVPPKGGRKRSRSPKGIDFLLAEGVDEKVARDWLEVRKVKKLPLTETAFEHLKGEALKAKLTVPQAVRSAVEHGWAGFKASWLENERLKDGATPAPAAEIERTKANLDAMYEGTTRAAPDKVKEMLANLKLKVVP